MGGGTAVAAARAKGPRRVGAEAAASGPFWSGGSPAVKVCSRSFFQLAARRYPIVPVARHYDPEAMPDSCVRTAAEVGCQRDTPAGFQAPDGNPPGQN
ncbi:hypothetical protein ASD45_10790 [Pseudolabrys sp. Root1462]|nr:hypothetical protein ASD45_10790 [Pseudolabrys sp. Root1462]